MLFLIPKAADKVADADLVLGEADIVRIRAPLLRLQDHLAAIEFMQEDMKRLNDHIIEFLSEVDGDRQSISSKLDLLK